MIHALSFTLLQIKEIIKKKIAFILIFYCFINFLGCDSKEKTPASKSPKISPKTQTSTQSNVQRMEKTSPNDWTMLMYDLEHSGQSPDSVLKPPLELKWKFKTGGQIKGSPVIAYDKVYVGSSDKRIYALKAKEWGEVWSFEAGGEILYTPTVWNKTVYFNATDDTIYALSSETGELKWKFKTKSWMESPVVVSNGKVYAGAFQRDIYILDAFTGKQIGKRNIQIRINGILYICNQGKFHPLNPVAKVAFWRNKTANSSSLPVSANGVVYIGAYDKKVHAFDKQTSEEIWTYETNGWIDSAPSISQGMLYVTSLDGFVYAFGNADDSKELKSDRQLGTVVRDRAVVYSLADKSSDKLAMLNDGRDLVVLEKKLGWYKVQLPNDKVGWMNENDFALFDEYDGFLLNSALVKDIKELVLPEGGESPHWSPDEQTIAFFVRTSLKGQYWRASELWISEEDNSASRKITDGLFYNPNLSWSLDSKWITFESYYMDEPYVWIIQRDGSGAKRLIKGSAPAFSPKSHQIAFRLWKKREDLLFRVNIDKSDLRLIAQMPIEGRISQFRYLDKPVWSPDGNRIALGIDFRHYKRGFARILIADKQGKNYQTVFTHSDYVENIQWHPFYSTQERTEKNKIVYVLSGSRGDNVDKTLDKRIVVTNLNNPKPPLATYKHTLPSLSPDGSRIIFIEREDCMGLKWKVWITELTGGKLIPLARTNLNVSSIDWLQRGICIWSTSSYIRAGKYRPAQTVGWLIRLTIFK